jgi:hypothetical protein
MQNLKEETYSYVFIQMCPDIYTNLYVRYRKFTFIQKLLAYNYSKKTVSTEDCVH